MNMLGKRIAASVLSAAVTFGSFSTLAQLPAAAADAGDEIAQKGLWITELYQNDVNRSKNSNTREENGYDSITLFDSSSDLMEYVELTNTSDDDINFNQQYKIYYNDKELNVTECDGSETVMIAGGETVVLWNCYVDDGPTEEQFRESMQVPDDVRVLTINDCGNWNATDTTIRLETTDGKICSAFSEKDRENTDDGFAVELKIPNRGYSMDVYKAFTRPAPGVVYSGQLNGQRQMETPEDLTANGVFITEVFANDIPRDDVYGIDAELMEYIELTNTTDRDINLNDEYELKYFVKEGSRRTLPLYQCDKTTQECILPAGGTAVIWCYTWDFKTPVEGNPNVPDEAAFREAHNIPDEVPVFLFSNQNGLNSTNRGFELYQKNGDSSLTLVSYYNYNGVTDLKQNKSAQLAVNPEGPEMLVYQYLAAPSAGVVEEGQYTFVEDDGSSVSLTLQEDTLPESIDEGEYLSVIFDVQDGGKLPRTGISLHYQFDNDGVWHSTLETVQRVRHLFLARIPENELFGHDTVKFYVCASNRYRNTLTDIYTVKINRLNAVDGIRTNMAQGDNIKGVFTVTANDGGTNENTKIYLDGQEMAVTPMFESGAYLSFELANRNNYFRNALLSSDGEKIADLVGWMTIDLNGKIERIDNRYFTYDADSGVYKTTLRFYSGTQGVTVDDYLAPDADRDNFTIKNIKMVLSNGNEYLPTLIGPDDESSNDQTNLSTDAGASHNIGPADDRSLYMDVSFEIPASEVDAVGYQMDTTTMTEGTHTLKVTDGTNEKEIEFVVDNTAPTVDVGVDENEQLSGQITIDPQIQDENEVETIVCLLDGEAVTLPYETTAAVIGAGEHKLEIIAIDAAGNEAQKLVHFSVEDVSMSVESAGTESVSESSASLTVSLGGQAAGAQVDFYQAQMLETTDVEVKTEGGLLPYIQYTVHTGEVKDTDRIYAAWKGTASNSDGTHAVNMFVLNVDTNDWDKVASANAEGVIENASFAAAGHVKDAKATIIIQCTADGAMPQLDGAASDNAIVDTSWDGNSRPENYDFCFAWITDTQFYSETYPQHFNSMNQWIVDNAEEWKIKYVMHTGDIVDEYDLTYEWENADNAMQIFDDAGMPYGVLGGNHDVAGGNEIYDNYTKYFGEDRFSNQPTYGGSYENNKGHYDLISQDGQDFIMLYMSWDIYQDEIDWMNEVLQQYSDRKAIILLHRYTNVVMTDETTYLDYIGSLLQENVVSKNPNVIAVLNGHYHGSSYETVKFDDDGDGVKERTVYQICTDWQEGLEGGARYIKFLYFDLDGNRIYTTSYSPYLEDYNYYDEPAVILNEDGKKATGYDAMILDVNFGSSNQTLTASEFSAAIKTDEKIASVKADENGNAAAAWTGLEEGTQYAWYFEADNGQSGLLESQVYDFMTYGPADYSRVDEMIEKANGLNKEYYVDFSGVQAAIDAVVRDKNSSEQEQVDAMAKAIEDAINVLEYKGADYSAVDKAIAEANALDETLYVDFSAVENAVKAVERGKNITEQAQVDAMAKAIEDAIDALVKKAPGASESPETGVGQEGLGVAALAAAASAAAVMALIRKKRCGR